MSGAIVVRAARPGDASEMGRIQVEAWQVGYRGLMPDDALDALDAQQRAETWHDALTRPADAAPLTSIPIVAEIDSQVTGIAAYGPYRAEATESGEGDRQLSELWMLNVDPVYWGTGVAQELNAHALQELARLFPAETPALWVLEGNLRGRRFYEKEGWEYDGATKQDELVGAVLTEVRYSIVP